MIAKRFHAALKQWNTVTDGIDGEQSAGAGAASGAGDATRATTKRRLPYLDELLAVSRNRRTRQDTHTQKGGCQVQHGPNCVLRGVGLGVGGWECGVGRTPQPRVARCPHVLVACLVNLLCCKPQLHVDQCAGHGTVVTLLLGLRACMGVLQRVGEASR